LAHSTTAPPDVLTCLQPTMRLSRTTQQQHARISYPPAVTSFALTALGVAVAWWPDNLQAFHAIQMTVLVPLWLVSGAMFPAGDSAVFAAIMRVNPMSYAVSAARHAFYSGQVAVGVTPVGPLADLAVLVVCAVVCLAIAVTVCARRS